MKLSQHLARAQRKARYGHRTWIVWECPLGKPHSAPATVDSLMLAIADTQGRKFSGFSRSTGVGNVLSPGLAMVWLSNARLGLLNR